MENMNTTLTEDQVKDISAELNKEVEKNEKLKLIHSIENDTYENKEESNKELEEDILDSDFMNFDNGNTKGIDLFQASIDSYNAGDEEMKAAADEISKKFKLSISDILELMEIAKRHRNKEKFSLYNAMPPAVKSLINSQIAQVGIESNPHTRALYCDLFVEEFASEFVDKYLSKEIIDFNKSIKETLDSITNVADMYAGHIRYMMEVELKKKAEESDNPQAKAIYLGCSKAFTDSYTFDKMIYAIHYNAKARRKLYKDNFQYNRYCADFNYKIKDTKYSIRNIEQMNDNLLIHLGKELDITEEDTKAFTILFIKATMNMDATALIDSMYLYYSIFNIVNLGFDTNKSKFYYTIVNNIKKVYNAIWESTGRERRFEIADDINWTEDDIRLDMESLKAMNKEV